MYLTVTENELGPTLNAHEFIHYELEFNYLNTPYMSIEEEITNILNERDDAADNQPIEEADDMQIGDVVVDKVEFKDVGSAFVTSKQISEPKPTNITPLI